MAKIISCRSIRSRPIRSRLSGAQRRCATDRSQSAAWSAPATTAFPKRCLAARCRRSRPTATTSRPRNSRRRTPAPASRRGLRCRASISDVKARCCSTRPATTLRSTPTPSHARQKTTAFRIRPTASTRHGRSPASSRTHRHNPTARRSAARISSQAVSSARPFSRTTASITSPARTAKITAPASARGRPS